MDNINKNINNMGNHAEMCLSENHFDPGLLTMISGGYDNMHNSGNIVDQQLEDENNGQSAKKRKYHRHTPQQIEELENFFKQCPHPDEKQRMELSSRIGMDSKQIKFWFQNRRTQIKTQLERHENVTLREENDRLRAENNMMKDAIRNPICVNCGGPAILGEISFEEHQLRADNARLKEEFNRINALTQNLVGHPALSIEASQENVTGLNSYGGVNPLGCSDTIHMGPEIGNRVSSIPPALPMLIPDNGMSSNGIGFDRGLVIETAVNSMNELMQLSRLDSPFWIRENVGGREVLNYKEYMKAFPLSIQMKPKGFVNKASRATDIVMSKSLLLVETMMDAVRWGDMFYSVVAKANTIDAISGGMSGTRNGCLQVMYAEHQVLSTLVPVRPVLFIRYCKQHADDLWAVVDVAVDPNHGGLNQDAHLASKILPSGFVARDMPDGRCKIVWVEHSAYDENLVHPLVHSGFAFGAHRWIGALKRHCDSFGTLRLTMLARDQESALNSAGRKSLLQLTHRMMTSFCSAVSASSVRKWEIIQNGNSEESVRIIMRKSLNDPGEPSGVMLSVATSIWLPCTQQHVFDLLCNEHLKSRWDVLSTTGPMQPMFHIQKAQGSENRITVLRARVITPGETNMLVLQEAWTDASASIIAYAPLDISSMNVVMNGGDTSNIALLPSGFAILPYGSPNPGRGANYNRGGLVTEKDESCQTGGCLLTINFRFW